MSDVGPPRLFTGERETLVTFYTYLRERLLAKLDGLDDASARRPGVESGTSLLGLAKHVLGVEYFWFGMIVAGLPESDLGDDDLRADDTIESVRAFAERIAEVTGPILESMDLDAATAAHPGRPDSLRPNNRWVLVHMIEETARHCGHADIIREQLDGSVGR